jgi:hypothetical protein
VEVQAKLLTLEFKRKLQGDQIRRFFANWGLFTLDKIEEINQIFGVLFPWYKLCAYALVSAKHELGHILGDFLTNSSGHPKLQV